MYRTYVVVNAPVLISDARWHKQYFFQFKNSWVSFLSIITLNFCNSLTVHIFLIASTAAASSEEAEDIIWTSSGSDFSDDGSKTLSDKKKSPASKPEESPSRHDLLLEDSSSEGELKHKQICQETFCPHQRKQWQFFEAILTKSHGLILF